MRGAHPARGQELHRLEPDCREGTPPPAIQFGDLAESAEQANCQLRTNLPDEGTFTSLTASRWSTRRLLRPPATTTRPDLGRRLTTPVTSDTSSSPNIRNAVHSMEHGRVEIHYKPSLPEDQQLALKGVFDEDSDGMLLFPDPDMPDDVAITAWRNIVVCPSYDPLVLDVIRRTSATPTGATAASRCRSTSTRNACQVQTKGCGHRAQKPRGRSCVPGRPCVRGCSSPSRWR